MGIIYCAQNKTNGKRYIGQSRHSLEVKKRTYIYSSRRRVKLEGMTPLLLALREFGEESFEWTIMDDDVDDEDLDQAEKDTIAVYRTQVPNGYNQMTGGQKGGSHSEDTRKKIKELRKRQVCTEETRKKMSRARKGRTLTDEHRKKISEGQRQRPLISKETRKKMSRSQKLRDPPSEETRKKLREAASRRGPRSEEHQKRLNEAHAKFRARRRAEFE